MFVPIAILSIQESRNLWTLRAEWSDSAENTAPKAAQFLRLRKIEPFLKPLICLILLAVGNRMASFLVILLVCTLAACSLLKKEDEPQPEVVAATKPLPPEKTKNLMSKVAGNWFYGQGLGETALTVGTVVAFPPYAIYVLGNGALSLAGYKPLHVTDALPEPGKEGWNSIYDTVTSGPGHVTAGLASKEFREKDVINQDMKDFMAHAYDKPEGGELWLQSE